jgi:hypothetical protein
MNLDRVVGRELIETATGMETETEIVETVTETEIGLDVVTTVIGTGIVTETVIVNVTETVTDGVGVMKGGTLIVGAALMNLEAEVAAAVVGGPRFPMIRKWERFMTVRWRGS